MIRTKMAEPRFEMVRISRERMHGRPYSGSATLVTWRFLSANNRNLARSVRAFPDEAACAQAVDVLKSRISTAEVITVRDEQGLWLWQLRLDGVPVGVSTRKYQRRLHAVNSGNSFHRLAEFCPDVHRIRRCCPTSFAGTTVTMLLLDEATSCQARAV